MRYEGLILITVIIVAWQGITAANLVSTTFVASPTEIAFSLANMFAEGSIWNDIIATFLRTLIAFIISVAIGTTLGIAIGYFRRVGYSTELLLDFLRSLPPIALFPLFILFFGIGDESKIAVASFMGALVITVAAMQGTKQIKKARLLLAKKIGLKGTKLFLKFLLPESLPTIFSGYRLAASLCLILIIVTEMFLGGQDGLGARLIDAQLLYNVAELYALIILAGLIGYSLNYTFLRLEKRIIHWQGK